MARSFTLSVANVRENAQNAIYPNIRNINNAQDLAKALMYDHTEGLFKGNHRKNDNFIKSNCIILDFDNTHSEDSQEWKTPEDIRKSLPDIEFYSCYSRNHMKQKGDKSPRPKFHIYMPFDTEITDASQIRAIKERILKFFPYADLAVKDAARLIFGVYNPDILYFDGVKDIITFLNEQHTQEPESSQCEISANVEKAERIQPIQEKPREYTAPTQQHKTQQSEIIPEGTRNSTLYKKGIHIFLIAKTGENAKKMFDNECQKCKPRLPDEECARIWQSLINSDIAKLKRLALKLGDRGQYISQAKSITKNENKIKMVCSAVFEPELMKEINRIAIKFLLQYKREDTARQRFWQETSKFIDSLGADTIQEVWNNARIYPPVQLAFLAREYKDFRSEYEKIAAEITDDKEQISSIWDKENGNKTEQKEGRSKYADFFSRSKEKTPLNIRAVEQALSDLGITARLNVITQKLEVDGIPENNPYVSDKFHTLSKARQRRIAINALVGILSPYLQDLDYSVSLPMLKGYISTIANINAYNPVAEMFMSQEWDGQDRIAEIYKIMGINTNAMYCQLVKKWLIQAVAMALNDEGSYGCDFVLTLQGRQGIGKTEFFRNIAIRPEWFISGADIDVRNKDSVITATTHWVCEIGEADATFKHEQAQLKSFISANESEYRMPYGESYDNRPRRTVFGATVNPEQFIKDTTGGSRRWATIRVNYIDSAKMRALPESWYIQLWAQVYNLFLNNPEGYRIESDDRAFIEQENQTAAEPLEGEAELENYLKWEADISEWKYSTPTEFLNKLAEEAKFRNQKLTPKVIGKALTKKAEYDSRLKPKKSNRGKAYLLPPFRNSSDSLCIIEENMKETDSHIPPAVAEEKSIQQEQRQISFSDTKINLTAYEFGKMNFLNMTYREIQNIYFTRLNDKEREKIGFKPVYIFVDIKPEGHGIFSVEKLNRFNTACKIYEDNSLHDEDGNISGYVINGVYKAS